MLLLMNDSPDKVRGIDSDFCGSRGGEMEVGATLEVTATWAVATAAAMFVLVSLLLERGIHRLGKWLTKRNQKPLRKALQKMTQELMLLGFISLLLTVLQRPFSKLCVPRRVATHWLPCSLPAKEEAAAPVEPADAGSHSRKMLMYGSVLSNAVFRRLLATEEASTNSCAAKGKAPFVSLEGLHQLHIFIFVLAVVHVFYSCLTMLLGFFKMHQWKQWEVQIRQQNETALQDTFLNVGNQDTRYAHFYEWMLCFFRQFVGSVSKSEYLIFRLAFLKNHHLTNKFNFHDYVIRSMEADFKVVVGISWWLWAFVIIVLLLNVHDWHTYFWMAFIPLILILIVGTKQEYIISTLAREARNNARKGKESSSKEMGTRDELFWFKYPGLLLLLIHFILFQNAFELAVFFWFWATFGWNTCLFARHSFILVRLAIGVWTQVLCSYSTLPLYALVTQMGSDYKPTIFKDYVHSALHGWHGKVRQKHKDQGKGSSLHSKQAKAGVDECEAKVEETEIKQVAEELPVGLVLATAGSPPDNTTSAAAAQKAITAKLLVLYGRQMKGSAGGISNFKPHD